MLRPKLLDSKIPSSYTPTANAKILNKKSRTGLYLIHWRLIQFISETGQWGRSFVGDRP